MAGRVPLSAVHSVLRCSVVGLVLVAAAGRPTIHAAAAPLTVIANVDLAKPFSTRSPWRFVATQGPQEPDSFNDGEMVPGAIGFCLKRSERGACDPTFVAMAHPPEGLDWEPHFLKVAKVVYPAGKSATPLLLTQTTSLPSGDGDRAVFTQLLAYRRASDRFVPIYQRVTGHNNNQEVRFVETGPLRGSVISAEPTEDKPFGYWITISKLRSTDAYRQVLRYRSATHYSDNNPLAVIDSEMPNIQLRLGLWRPGMPLPRPARGCGKPHLINTELWCG